MPTKCGSSTPFGISEYEKDFTNEKALAEFRSVLAQCGEIKVCRTQENAKRDVGYSALGRKLVSCSGIILALWGGVIDTNVLPGGTADVLTMSIEGFVDDASLLFSKPNKTHCKWLVTNHICHTSLPASIKSEKILAPGRLYPFPVIKR